MFNTKSVVPAKAGVSVMAGLVPAIHGLNLLSLIEAWMPATSAA
jgi:hypothetical protein